MLTNDDAGRAVVDAAIKGAIRDAARSGLITLNAPRMVVHEPTEGERSRRSVDVSFVFDEPYTVAEGREQELQGLLEAAVRDAIG